MKASLHRRQVLRGGALLLAGIAAPAIARASADVRSLAFDNIHTGEKLNIAYWNAGQYIPDALSTIDRLLRDFRNGEVHAIAPGLLDLLNRLHATLESASPFQVISGYRSPQTNAMLHAESHGVASKSLHMKGMAIDIRLADRSLADLHTAALGLRGGGVGYYPGPDFVHVDVGRVRTW